MPGAEEEGEAAGIGAGGGIVGFVAEGEAPLPIGATFVVNEEEGAGVGVMMRRTSCCTPTRFWAMRTRSATVMSKMSRGWRPRSMWAIRVMARMPVASAIGRRAG